MLVEHLEEALFRGERPKFVYTVPNFGNPSGVTMTLERRQQLVALCRETGSRSWRTTPTGCCGSTGIRSRASRRWIRTT